MFGPPACKRWALCGVCGLSRPSLSRHPAAAAFRALLIAIAGFSKSAISPRIAIIGGGGSICVKKVREMGFTRSQPPRFWSVFNSFSAFASVCTDIEAGPAHLAISGAAARAALGGFIGLDQAMKCDGAHAVAASQTEPVDALCVRRRALHFMLLARRNLRAQFSWRRSLFPRLRRGDGYCPCGARKSGR
jgi:hypothetical protein